jgi:bifunctional non-homologous end joining protein LigD
MADNLTKYREKRDLKKTAEPSGGASVRSSNGRRFAIQKHDSTRLHYDLRLELDGVFKSWAVTKGPSLDPQDKRLAVEVEDHPLDYGDFGGTIPKELYCGGTVLLWDRGYGEPDGNKSPEQRRLRRRLQVHSSKVTGCTVFVLVRMRGNEDEKRTNCS